MRVPFESYPVPVLSYNIQSTQHIQSIINSPLYILEVEIHISLLVNFDNLVCDLQRRHFSNLERQRPYIGACGLLLHCYLLKHFLRKEHQLLVL